MTLIAYEQTDFRPASLEMIDKVNSLVEEYEAQGYSITLRQLYYRFVARKIIPENTLRAYKNLGNLINKARKAGLVSWTAIEDRNRSTSIWLIQEDELEAVNGIENNFALDLWGRQGVYVEVWVEKDALIDIVRRVASEWRAPCMACKGYLSSSWAWRAAVRFYEKHKAGMDCHLIHLGDHDPSGVDMTRDNEDRLELFSLGTPIKVNRIALNMNQIEQYNPPPDPAKLSDSRAAEYISRFGPTSWELDALDPRTLDELIRSAILELIPDIGQWNADADEEHDRRETLRKVHERWSDVKHFLENEQ